MRRAMMRDRDGRFAAETPDDRTAAAFVDLGFEMFGMTTLRTIGIASGSD